MLIVSDTGPLRYLCEIGHVDVLPEMYGQLITTPQVLRELKQRHFPPAVSQWADAPPTWLLIEYPTRIDYRDQLDEGEASAISLALQRHADAVLIDERHGTNLARSLGIPTLGTLAVLHDAGIAGLIDFHAAIRRLTDETQFRHSKALINQVIADFDAEVQRQTKREKPH